MKRIVLLFAILFSFGLTSYAQKDNPCDPGSSICIDGTCHTNAECNRKNPPPPGLVLPIDSNIYFLLAAGLGLGIYFLGFTGKKYPASSSAAGE
jgi:hypothetical protein